MFFPGKKYTNFYICIFLHFLTCSGFYCPGDGKQIPCPKFTYNDQVVTDYEEILDGFSPATLHAEDVSLKCHNKLITYIPFVSRNIVDDSFLTFQI